MLLKKIIILFYFCLSVIYEVLDGVFLLKEALPSCSFYVFLNTSGLVGVEKLTLGGGSSSERMKILFCALKRAGYMKSDRFKKPF